VRVGLLGDQREEPFGIGVTEYQVAVGTEPRVELRQLAEPAVVRHDPASHRKRMGVLHRPAARRREPDVCHKGRRLSLLGLVREFLVTERRFRLLIEHRLARGIEAADAGAVDVAVALHLQRIGGINQPEGRPDPRGARRQTKQPAHRASTPELQD
jgi:hypothetical protein